AKRKVQAKKEAERKRKEDARKLQEEMRNNKDEELLGSCGFRLKEAFCSITAHFRQILPADLRNP
ncbi:unnamed protein product, partial [Symbiodinium necroappetens]